MKLNIAGGAYKTFSKHLNAQECINFYTHLDKEDAASVLSLRGFPGLKEWCNTGEYAEVRGEKKLGTHLYSVIGNKVFRISTNKTVTQCTGNLSTFSGKVSMAANASQIMIVDGIYGYIVSVTTVTKITDSGFPANPQTVTERGGYFIVSVQNSGRGHVSPINNGLGDWDSTSYFNAEGNPDNTVAVFEDNLKLIMFGEKSIDPHYLSSSTVPFDQYPGLYKKVGLGAKHSPANVGDMTAFLTNHFTIAQNPIGDTKAISPGSINHQIARYSKKDDAIGMGIDIEGQAFYILTFPDANATWCCNFTTGLFNQLMSYPEPYQNRWRGNCAEFFDDKWIIGDYQNGKLYELNYDTFTDNEETIRRVRTLPAIRQDGKRIFHNRLRVFFEMGVGLDGGVQGSDPQVMMRYSDDGGHTWSNEFWRSIGKMGEYDLLFAEWKQLGNSRHRNYEFTITDPFKCVMIDGDLEATIGTS